MPTKKRKQRQQPAQPQPRKHHLDRRAGQILAADTNGAYDEMLTTRQVAQWFGVSEQFLEIARSRGYGPQYVMMAARTIRYRRDACRRWLQQRTYGGTAEYRK